MVKVNGEMINAAEKNILELLELQGCKSGRVAVEVNGKIVPRSEYDKTILNDGDSVEIVRFVGGG